MIFWLHSLDIRVFAAIHRTLWETPAGEALFWIGYGGDARGLIPLLLLVAFLSRGARVRNVVAIAAALIVSATICHVLKKIVGEPRPSWFVPDLVLSRHPDLPRNAHSWPSGHTTAAFAFAMTVLALVPRNVKAWGPAVALAALVGLSRIAVGAHFPTDVLAGAFLGGLVGWIAGRVASRVREPAVEVVAAPPLLVPQPEPSPAREPSLPSS